MPERIKHLMDWLPFVALITGRPGPIPIMTRMVETLIMSAVAGAFGVYVTVQVMKSDVDYIKQEVRDIKQSIEQIRKDMYIPRGVIGS